MLKIVLMVLAGVFALNLLFVGWLAFLSFLQRRREPELATNVREIPRRDSLPPLMDRRASRRLVGAVTLAAMLFAGTAFASPHAREMAASVLGTVAQGLQIGPSVEATPVAAPLVGQSEPAGARRGAARSVPPVRGTSAPAPASTPAAHGSGASGAPVISYPPAVPTAVTASSTSSTSISLGWTDVATETGYRVERSMDGASGWTPLGTTAGDVAVYGDTGLQQGTTYYYRVIATNAEGESAPSDVSSATTSVDPASPTTVNALSLSATSIGLTWADVGSETGYRVERSADGVSGWITLTTTGQDVTAYEDAGLQPGTTYYYRVFATNAGGDSAASDVASATTGTDSPSPAVEVFPPAP